MGVLVSSNYDVLRSFHADSHFSPEGLIKVLERMNDAINDRHYSVGVSYFLDRCLRDTVQDIWVTEIKPYIEELFFDRPEKATCFTWDNVSEEILG